VTIGQVSYFSNVTQHNESLLVTVNIMASKHCDAMLLDLVKDILELWAQPGCLPFAIGH